jgi:hypothetical protein
LLSADAEAHRREGLSEGIVAALKSEVAERSHADNSIAELGPRRGYR